MKTLTIGFSRPKKSTIFSRLIEYTDDTAYDHVYIKWNWAVINRDVIYQASKFAVNFESNVTFDSHATTIESYDMEISDECHIDIIQFCMDNCNKPYSIRSLFGFALVKMCSKFGKKVHNPFPTYGASFVCSKIAAEVAARAGIRIDADFDDIDPLDLNNIIKRSMGI